MQRLHAWWHSGPETELACDGRHRGNWLKVVLGTSLALLVITVLILSFVPNSPVQSSLLSAFSYIEGLNKPLGSFIFIVLYIFCIALVLPGTPLNLAAGYLFGVWLGSFCSILGITLGAIVAFALGKTLMRGYAEKKMESSKFFRALDKAVKLKGFVIVFLLRLAPVVPFGLCCYVLGVSGVSFSVYTTASFLGLFIPTAAYCYLGTLIKDLKDIFQSDESSESKTSQIVSIVVIAVTTVLLIVVVAWVTKRALTKAMQEEEAGYTPLNEIVSSDPAPSSVPIRRPNEEPIPPRETTRSFSGRLPRRGSESPPPANV